MLANNKNCQTFLQLTFFTITYLQLTISIPLTNGIFSINGLNGTQGLQLLRYPYNSMRPDGIIFCWPNNSFWLIVSISTVPFPNGFEKLPTMAQLSVILRFAPISVPLHHNMICSPYTYAIWRCWDTLCIQKLYDWVHFTRSGRLYIISTHYEAYILAVFSNSYVCITIQHVCTIFSLQNCNGTNCKRNWYLITPSMCSFISLFLSIHFHDIFYLG